MKAEGTISSYFDGSKIRWSWAREAWRQLMVGTQYDLMPFICMEGSEWALSCVFPSRSFWGAKKEGEKEESSCCLFCPVSLCNQGNN